MWTIKLSTEKMTNNINLVRGTNARSTSSMTSSRIDANVMSPKWMYNLINDGEDKGALFPNAMNVAYSYGCATWADSDGVTTASNYLSWNPNTSNIPIWENALKNKVNKVSYIDVTPDDSNSMDLIKSILANGYVVSFDTDLSTNLNNWNYIYSSSTPSRKVTNYVETASGGHAMTIVGYDDTISTAVGGVTVSGAFKIVNSWGDISWGPHTDGYIWLFYDALRGKNQSIISSWNASNRRSAITNNRVYLFEPKVSYTPLLLAEVMLNTAARNQLVIEIGMSPNSTPNPTSIINIAEYEYYRWSSLLSGSQRIAFNDPICNGGGNRNFTGGTTAANETFTFDLTPVVRRYIRDNNIVTQGVSNMFYVRITDTTFDGKINRLVSFKLIDKVNNKTVTSTDQNLDANGSTKTAYVEYTIVPKIFKASVTAGFNYPIQSSTINSSNVFIKNKAGNIMDVPLLTQSPDRKSLTIKPPNNTVGVDYPNGNFYSLFLTTGIKTDGGNPLPAQKQVDFYVP